MSPMRCLAALCTACIAVAAAIAQPMRHPGVLVDQPQIDFIKRETAAHHEPFFSEYRKAAASQWGSFDYQMQGPPSTGVIDCGPYSHPDNGCHAEDDDATAAFVQALLWNLTGDHRYAENAIRIVNAYAHHVTGYANSNAPLQAAWSSQMWPRAGELLRYSHSGWQAEDIAAFSQMLTKVNLPLIRNGSGSNGNWELSMIEGVIGIAVFTDDRALLAHGEQMWRDRVPAYFYDFALDGPHPRPMPTKDRNVNWYGITDLSAAETGIAQETCRDLTHTGYGISAATAAAETAHIQGDRLFESEKERLAAALEFHAHLLLRSDPVSSRVCGGAVNYGRGFTFGIGYNALANRLGIPLPYTQRWLLQGVLPAAEPVDIHTTAFELLTHGADATVPSKNPFVK